MSIEGGSIEDGLINTVEGDTVDLRLDIFFLILKNSIFYFFFLNFVFSILKFE